MDTSKVDSDISRNLKLLNYVGVDKRNLDTFKSDHRCVLKLFLPTYLVNICGEGNSARLGTLAA